MKRHRQPLELNSQINITNLLDTALTLLCGFMIVAPTLKSGIPVELPQVEKAETLTETEDNTLRITIAVPDPESVEDKILVDGRRVRLPNLSGLLAERKAENPNLAVTIDSDKDVRFETGARVMSALNVAGIENFSIATDPLAAAYGEEDAQE